MNYRLTILLNGKLDSVMEFAQLETLHVVERTLSYKYQDISSKFIHEKYDSISKMWFTDIEWNYKTGSWNTID